MLIPDVSRILLDGTLVPSVKGECGDVQISGQATCPVASRRNHTDDARECANNLKSERAWQIWTRTREKERKQRNRLMYFEGGNEQGPN